MLGSSLRELRLTHFRNQLSNLLVEAGEAELNLRHPLIKLCRHDRDSKRGQRTVRHLKQAWFAMLRTVADFDVASDRPSAVPAHGALLRDRQNPANFESEHRVLPARPGSRPQ